MKAALKKKWIAALRSGKYKQTQGTLVEDFGEGRTYCCLGVLRNCVTGKDRYNSAAGDTTLSRPFLKRVGLTPDQQDEAATMNDDGESFLRIATWIGRNL